ncbi:MAG: hypothetical protein IPI79_02655 [Moraxellaceae bacterium]|nr:hypothetical protein [Moraxellaceae bacterium]
MASQLYVRMRRYGRVVDAVYMAKNHDYAREILQLAGREADVEILKIIVRFEILLAHEYPSIEPTKAVEPEEKLVVEKDKDDILVLGHLKGTPDACFIFCCRAYWRNRGRSGASLCWRVTIANESEF